MKIIHKYNRLYGGILLRRYRRFLVDIRLDDGREITAFTPNSGSMRTCSDPGSPAMLSYDPKPGRVTEFTLEMVRSGGTWVGVNTLLANTLGANIIDAGLTDHPDLEGFTVAKKEVIFEDSRLDLLASNGSKNCYVEVKNVTYRVNGLASFPDAVTTRGKKHLETLIRASLSGTMACTLFIVQRSDCMSFTTARDIDPKYAEAFKRAAKTGVIIIPSLLHVEPAGIFFKEILPLAEAGD